MKFNVLSWDECDQEYKMVVKQGNPICTQMVNDDGDTIYLKEVYHGLRGWIACYCMKNYYDGGKC